MLILFQSCVAYKDTSSTIEEASSEKDIPIKIITKDGTIYKLSWIEEKDENLVSIKNTERASVDKSKITQIFPDGVTLEFALKHNVPVQIKTKKHKYDFIAIEEQDDLIKGLAKVKTGGDTLSVVIPIDQIEKIQLQDKGKSSGRTVGVIIGVGFGVVMLVGIAAMIEDGGLYNP